MKKLFAKFLLNWEVYVSGAAAAVLALSLYTAAIYHNGYVKGSARATTKVVTQIVKQTGKETVRRETVLQKVQVRSQADIAKIDRLATERATLLEEINRASVAHNGDTCLSRDQLVRLSAIR